MDYRKAKIGTRVTFTKDTDMAPKGDTGFINELRGYNFARSGREKTGRYVGVWVVRNLPAFGKALARRTEHQVMACTEVLELI